MFRYDNAAGIHDEGTNTQSSEHPLTQTWAPTNVYWTDLKSNGINCWRSLFRSMQTYPKQSWIPPRQTPFLGEQRIFSSPQDDVWLWVCHRSCFWWLNPPCVQKVSRTGECNLTKDPPYLHLEHTYNIYIYMSIRMDIYIHIHVYIYIYTYLYIYTHTWCYIPKNTERCHLPPRETATVQGMEQQKSSPHWIGRPGAATLRLRWKGHVTVITCYPLVN